jgi:hypothetical protein
VVEQPQTGHDARVGLKGWSLIVAAVVVTGAGCRGAHESTAVASSSAAGITTTTSRPAASPAIVEPATAAQQDAAGRSWIEAHGGRALDVRDVESVAISSQAIYSLIGGGHSGRILKLVRVDRGTSAVTSAPVTLSYVEIMARGDRLFLFGVDMAGGPKKDGDVLQRLDPGTLRTMWSVSGSFGPQLAATGDVIWSVDHGNRLLRFDVSSGARSAAITLPTAAAAQDASIAVDPSGRTLWVGYGASPTMTLETREPHTGALIRRVHEPSVAIGPPNLTATDRGVWAATRGGMKGSAVYYDRPDLRETGSLPGAYDMGVDLTWVGRSLWLRGGDLVGCADPRTGRYLATPRFGHSEPLAQGPRSTFSVPAVDRDLVALAVGGRLATFTANNLCSNAAA